MKTINSDHKRKSSCKSTCDNRHMNGNRLTITLHQTLINTPKVCQVQGLFFLQYIFSILTSHFTQNPITNSHTEGTTRKKAPTSFCSLLIWTTKSRGRVTSNIKKYCTWTKFMKINKYFMLYLTKILQRLVDLLIMNFQLLLNHAYEA